MKRLFIQIVAQQWLTHLEKNKTGQLFYTSDKIQNTNGLKTQMWKIRTF